MNRSPVYLKFLIIMYLQIPVIIHENKILSLPFIPGKPAQKSLLLSIIFHISRKSSLVKAVKGVKCMGTLLLKVAVWRNVLSET